MAKAKAINTKLLQTTVADFVKLYNIELTDPEATKAKEAIEKSLIEKVKEEANKYEK